MDKKKTGNLIKEARTKKNYTQRELGDLLGVTNKAISRWENGESFPDVGILENMSSVLDISIQDIVTGEIQSNYDVAITELVRFAKLQQREKIRKLTGYIIALSALLCCLIAGYSGLSSSGILLSDSVGTLYIVLLAITLILAIYGCISQDKGTAPSDQKLSKRLCYLSVISFVSCALITWTFMLLITNGIVPFGMKVSSIGPLINSQLVAFFLINTGILVVELYRNGKSEVNIHWGYMVSIASVYLAALYGDMLHRIDSVDSVLQILSVRTLAVIVMLSVSLLFVKYWGRKKLSKGKPMNY